MGGKENIAGRRHSVSKGWKVRKHAVFGNVKFSKVHTMSILHILLVNTLNGNVCFDTGLCWSLMARFLFSPSINATVSRRPSWLRPPLSGSLPRFPLLEVNSPSCDLHSAPVLSELYAFYSIIYECFSFCFPGLWACWGQGQSSCQDLTWCPGESCTSHACVQRIAGSWQEPVFCAAVSCIFCYFSAFLLSRGGYVFSPGACPDSLPQSGSG